MLLFDRYERFLGNLSYFLISRISALKQRSLLLDLVQGHNHKPLDNIVAAKLGVELTAQEAAP